MRIKRLQHLKQQNGAILFVSLIILVLLTILGLSSLRTTLLQEKMTANYKNKSSIFQGAEAALRAGEKWMLDEQSNSGNKPVADQTIIFDENDLVDTANKKWWWDTDADGNPIEPALKGEAGPLDASVLVGSNRKQRYIIQLVSVGCHSLESPCPKGSIFYIYRISAIDIGVTGISVLESYLRLNLNP
jgi:Tfp pilus assembly protein PilX